MTTMATKQTKQKPDAAEMGGTLFVPATHKNVPSVATGQKYPNLRSVVFDTEDGITSDALDAAIEQLAQVLSTMPETKLKRFIRARDASTLSRICALPGIEKIDGFVLPKFGLDNADQYLEAIGTHYFMPSIEGIELFDAGKLAQLRDILLGFQQQIILIRFGAEDMQRQLGLRRSQGMSLYDMCAPSHVIASLLLTFKPYGFRISAPVYRFFKDSEGFEREVKRDLQEGLLSKTIIHPSQIDPIEKLYQVSSKEFAEAQELVNSKKAVFASSGCMAEPSTQRPWAHEILKRAALYGVEDEEATSPASSSSE